jgi:hypothetical protein
MATSYLKTYFGVLLIIFLVIGVVNFTVDPLWYGRGNIITKINPPWNERIAKTNLLLQNPQAYDCLILGTSRATLLSSSFLQHNRCFNYSFSGGKPEELVNYSEYVKRKNFEPVKIYVEIEPDSLNRKSEVKPFREVADPIPMYQAYLFSFNTFWLSLKTLLGQYSYARVYDQNFQVQLSEDIPRYDPEFDIENEDHLGCDPNRLQFYQSLRQLFPQAVLVGFVAPVSAWRVYNTQYANGLLNCQLANIHQLTDLFDQLYDFSVPSAITERTDNTYDGNHYYPAVFKRIAAVLEGRTTGFGINVENYALADYKALYQNRMRAFLAEVSDSKEAS